MSSATVFARSVAGRSVRRLPAGVFRLVLRTPFGVPFATFERDDGSRLELLSEYRDHIKARWRLSWWPSRVLLGLRYRVELPPEHRDLAAAIDAARTLPVSYAELGAAVAGLSRLYPNDVRPLERIDPRLSAPVLELVPLEEESVALAHAYGEIAARIAATAAAYGVRIEGARVLDAGTGSGYLAYALAALGADVVAVDVDPYDYVFPAERERVRVLTEGPEPRARLVQADVHELPFEDGTFDLVVSLTAIEHFADAPRAFRELHRVLRPGGLGHYAYDPWFGIRGGHGLCTLDVPWGHVRLTRDEIERYVGDLRPHEASDAVAYLRTGFQTPPLTLDETRGALVAAGYRILEWRETPLPAANPHRAVLTKAMLRDCRRVHPAVTRRDLLTLGCTTVVRR